MTGPGGPPEWSYYVSAAASLGTAAAAILAAAKFWTDSRSARRQKRSELAQRDEANAIAARDLRWRKSQAAQALIEKMAADPVAHDVGIMLDWSGRKFPTAAVDPPYEITTAKFAKALRLHGVRGEFSDEEAFVRDSFDRFLWYFELIEQQIRLRLVDVDDVRFPLTYFVRRMDGIDSDYDDAVAKYLDVYEFHGAIYLIRRLSAAQPGAGRTGP